MPQVQPETTSNTGESTLGYLPSDFSKELTCWSRAHRDLRGYSLSFQNSLLSLTQLGPQTSMSGVELSNPEALTGSAFQAPHASVLPSASRWTGLSKEGPECWDVPWAQPHLRRVQPHGPALRFGSDRAGCCQLPLNSAESRGRISPQSAASSQGLSYVKHCPHLGGLGLFLPVDNSASFFLS